jgi:hypothetical protein
MDIQEKREKLRRMRELRDETVSQLERQKAISIEMNEILWSISRIPIEEFISDLDDSDLEGIDGDLPVLRIIK